MAYKVSEPSARRVLLFPAHRHLISQKRVLDCQTPGRGVASISKKRDWLVLICLCFCGISFVITTISMETCQTLTINTHVHTLTCSQEYLIQTHHTTIHKSRSATAQCLRTSTTCLHTALVTHMITAHSTHQCTRFPLHYFPVCVASSLG